MFIGLGGTFTTPSLNKVALLFVPENGTGTYMGFFQLIQFGTGAFASGILGLLLSGNENLPMSNIIYIIGSMFLFILVSLGTIRIEYKIK